MNASAARRARAAPAREARPGAAPRYVVVYRESLLNYNEVYVRTEIEALRRYRGFYVGAERVRGAELPSDRTLSLRESYGTIDGVLDPVITRVGWRLNRVRALAPLGSMLSDGRVVGRTSRYLFQVHGMSGRLVRRLRSLSPAIVHAYTGVSGAHALPLARALNVPLVTTFNGYDATATDEELAQWPTRGRVFLRRRAAMKRDAQLIITVAEFLRRKLIDRGWPSEKIVVLYTGVDTELFTPTGAPPLAERAPIVFSAGRLIEKKGMTYLLRAMQEVQRHVPDAELVLAGSGPLREALEGEAGDLRVRARFLGEATPAEMRAQLARAQAYCMPSVRAATGDSEGLPNALTEAMAAGLPIVASTSAGIPEAVDSCGFLVPERDPAALAGRLVALLQDAALRERMGVAARERALQQFDLRTQASRLETLYDRVRDAYVPARA